MELVLGWYTGIHPRVSSHKRNITHNDSFPYRYNYKRAVYFLHINLGREISFYLSLFLSRYTINDWSMANGLLFRFKLQSLPIAPCISRIYTVRSWWASRINHPTWVHRANMNFCRSVSLEEYYSTSLKANYTICIMSINLLRFT